MSEDKNTLEDLKELTGAEDVVVIERKRVVDDLGRSYATGKRKDAVARVWIKPGSGKITINEDSSYDVGLASATDPDGDPMSFAVSSYPQNGAVVMLSDGSFTYSPAQDYYGIDYKHKFEIWKIIKEEDGSSMVYRVYPQ